MINKSSCSATIEKISARKRAVSVLSAQKSLFSSSKYMFLSFVWEGVLDKMILWRFGSGRPIDSKVFFPMITAWPDVICRKRLRSDFRCQGNELSQPITFPGALRATINEIDGIKTFVTIFLIFRRSKLRWSRMFLSFWN